jgi:hypothetical protein
LGFQKLLDSKIPVSREIAIEAIGIICKNMLDKEIKGAGLDTNRGEVAKTKRAMIRML